MTIEVGLLRLAPLLETWQADMAHPTEMRFISGHGSDADAAKADFVVLYNDEFDDNKTLEDFDFQRRALVSAEIYTVGEKWECYASGFQIVTVQGDTEQEAKETFMTTWNAGCPAPFEEIEFTFYNTDSVSRLA